MIGLCHDYVEGCALMLPRADKIRVKAFGAVLSLGLLLGAALLPGCFSSCTGTPAPPAAPAAQTPPAPMPAPAVQTPTAPAPGPAVQTPVAPGLPGAAAGVEAPKEEPPKPSLTLESLHSIREGMTSREVSEKIGTPGVLIAGTDKASTVYRWNGAGLSLLARFEDDKLTRKSIITAKGDEISAETYEKKSIDRDLYDGVRPGMTFEEVMNRIGIEPQLISKSGAAVSLYAWRDGSGSSFVARFEDGKLVRKTGFFDAKSGDKDKGGEGTEAERVEGKEAAADTEDTAEKAEETAGVNPDNAGQTATGDSETGDSETGAASETVPPGPRKARITVAGSSRRERQAENGEDKPSYRPKAQLPRNLHRLRHGSYEIRIHNTAESRVKASVVSQEGAAEATIPAGGKQSVFVNQGDYVVHFIYDDDPYTLHQGGVIPIGQWLTDMEVFLFGGSYNVQVLDHATDRPPPRDTLPRR